MTTGWLLREGEVLASLEVADTRAARRRGLLGRDEIEGALLLWPCRSVHTFGMRVPIDVALLDGDLRVVRAMTVPARRVVLPRPGVRAVLEAGEGAFGSWLLLPGQVLEVREAEDHQ